MQDDIREGNEEFLIEARCDSCGYFYDVDIGELKVIANKHGIVMLAWHCPKCWGDDEA